MADRKTANEQRIAKGSITAMLHGRNGPVVGRSPHAQYPDASSTQLDAVVVPCGHRHVATNQFINFWNE